MVVQRITRNGTGTGNSRVVLTDIGNFLAVGFLCCHKYRFDGGEAKIFMQADGNGIYPPLFPVRKNRRIRLIVGDTAVKCRV